MIEREGARLVVQAARAVDRQRAHAEAAQQAGAHGADRAETHDYDIETIPHRGILCTQRNARTLRIVKLILLAFSNCLALALFPMAAWGQPWPAKPVRWILSQPPGSSPDATARLIAERLSRQWEQSIVVDNRPGGQNVIGAQLAARSRADGYTYYYATTAALVINAYTFKSLPYDPQKDFAPVGMIGMSPFIIAVHPALPAKNLPELIALAKAKPGALAYATEGARTFSGMLGDMFGATAGVKMLQVPFVSPAQGITDTIAGRTQLTFQAAAAVTPFIRSGALRALAVSSGKRMQVFPDVPAISETLSGFEYVGWHAVVAPAGAPAAAIRRFNRDLDAALNDRELAQRLLNLGPITEGAGTPEALAAFLSAERARWKGLVERIGVVPE